jgi:hypothetical protein
MATRIRICKDGASFVQMEFIRSYGVDRNKEGNVARWLWNHVSISRISSPAKKIRQLHWNKNFITQVFHLRQGKREPVINPLGIKIHIHIQNFHATFLNKHMKSYHVRLQIHKKYCFAHWLSLFFQSEKEWSSS